MLIEMQVKGLMIDPVQNMPIIILRDADNQRALPIWVGPVEANAIALQIENVSPPRPMTHDLLRNLLEELGATLNRVDHRGPSGRHVLRVPRACCETARSLFVDARPSDAIALSMRAKVPIFVDTKVLDQAKSVEVSSDRTEREHLQSWLESLDPDDLGYKM